MPHKLIRIASAERNIAQSISSTNFKISFNNAQSLQSVKRIIIKNAVLPNVMYNVNSLNNIFTYKIGATPFNITLSVGQYILSDLITAIEAHANALGVGLTILLNNTTKKLEFASTTPITYLTETENIMARILGLTSGSVGDVLTFPAPGFPDLSGVQTLYIASEVLSDGSNLIDAVLQAVPVIAVIPINVPYGGFAQYSTEHSDIDHIDYGSQSSGKNIQHIDVRVYDDTGDIVDFQGLDWVMILKIYY